MTEEKILKDEVLSDSELDEVAGGTTREIQDDANRLRALERRYNVRLLPSSGNASAADVNDAMFKVGQIISDSFHCDFHIGCDLKLGNESNSYYLNHKKMNHNRIWEEIYNKINY